MKKLLSIFLLLTATLLMNSCGLFKARIGAHFQNNTSGYSDSNEDTNTDTNTDLAITKVKAFDKKALNNEFSNNSTGVYVGISFLEISLTDKLEFQPELNFIAIKNFNQIQTPILLKYNIVDKFSAYAGPSFGFLLDRPEGIDSFNVALDFGLSYDITEKFSVETRYDWGQTNLLDGGDSDNYFKLNSFQVGVTYKFDSKK
ncbi:outer membrane beta-barrel protein [Aureibaculum luteum]|uniref:outer membrane beta-barrel protein n=1 Tax=Aureibaculum luteum TaxID=1548456 RepID=UPI000E46ABA2|nr:outer membrane beta-barrel protein [Aureibaculum luteum]